MDFGPVQMLVIGFEDGKFSGEILAELRRLREHDIVRLVDLLFVPGMKTVKSKPSSTAILPRTRQRRSARLPARCSAWAPPERRGQRTGLRRGRRPWRKQAR